MEQQNPFSKLPYSVKISGKTYNLEDFHEIPQVDECTNAQLGKLMYFTGCVIKTPNKLQLKKNKNATEVRKDVCFVAFTNKTRANDNLKIKDQFNEDSRVMLPMTSTIINYKTTEYYVVVYPRFDSLAVNNGLQFETASSSSNVNRISGNPDMTIACALKELTQIVIEMQSKDITNRWLGLPIGYVKCCETGLIKMIIDVKPADTPASKERMNSDFCKMVKTFLTTPSFPSCWPQRDSFFECFEVKGVSYNDRLEMIRDHPFLEVDFKKNFNFLHEIEEALDAYTKGKTKNFRGRDLAYLCKSMYQSYFKDQFIDENTGWTRKSWCDKFVEAYDFKRYNSTTGQVIKYNPNDLFAHLRFLKNVHKHLRDQGQIQMSDDSFLNEVDKTWPNMMHRYHEMLYKSD